MFAFLRGVVSRSAVNRIDLDIHGIGFEVFVPDSIQRSVTVNQEITLLTYCHIREDCFQIFGFCTEQERTLFKMCLGVKGVGPKVALGLLSVLGEEGLIRAVREQRVNEVSRAPGVGEKLARRIILELKSKCGELPELSTLLTEQIVENEDIYEGLINLGSTQEEASAAVAYARKSLGPDANEKDLVTEALRYLSKVKYGKK